MLTQLTINNFAIVRQLEIELAKGMSVITGETGAGKSIVIDAISAILGERAYRDMVRTGAAKASVRALFRQVPELPWFQENGSWAFSSSTSMAKGTLSSSLMRGIT